ncbi:MAG TPA: undecaprenyl-diphosphate phosphatase [Thermoanaerobaculia bacterium]|nr:undecaprenyl-diphosphate phosphatase [Thermoanaerobaculia bacterium]
MSVTLGQAVLLGVVQGLTEFLPVSSTAHLALVQRFLPGFAQPGILFDVLLHVGTLFAVVVYFRSRIAATFAGAVSSDPPERRKAWKLIGLLLLAVGLTGLVTMPLKRFAIEGMTEFRRMGVALLGTAVLLFVAQRVGDARGDGGRSLEEMRPRDAALVGACQSVSAILHGFSRSGNTISVGLFAGLSRRAAAEFSFLLSIPTILAAAAVENLHAYRHKTGPLVEGGSLPAYAAGMAVAAVVGYFAISALLRMVVSMRLWPFIVYCAAVGLFLLLFAEQVSSGFTGELKVPS